VSRHPTGTIYLLHFDQPVSDHARHYLGWASDLAARLEAHREGRGARLMEVCRERGISWHLARTWEGTRDRERAIKDRAESPRLCPDCTPTPRPVSSGRSSAAAPEPKTPAPEPNLPWPWPGRPDVEAEASGYAEYQGLADALESKWRAEVSEARIEVPAPRAPEPEIEASEPELEIDL
jgi:predicted GIY-YIG superfamily endonuclease